MPDSLMLPAVPNSSCSTKTSKQFGNYSTDAAQNARIPTTAEPKTVKHVLASAGQSNEAVQHRAAPAQRILLTYCRHTQTLPPCLTCPQYCQPIGRNHAVRACIASNVSRHHLHD
eukprot:GHRR01030556.1.p2 GENE.GHRR01030556.1~~GHRR01030556.1.p2  ORF type:complete len:115 (-),score=18.31 GHRR01030556.1:1361-1705(-)